MVSSSAEGGGSAAAAAASGRGGFSLKQTTAAEAPGIDRSRLPTMTRLGLQDMEGEESSRNYEILREVNGYTFETPPATRYSSRQAEQRFVRMFGSMNPTFSPDRFDKLRERAQVQQKKERDEFLIAVGQLYHKALGDAFLVAKNVDYAEFERMLHPSYVPTYDVAMRTLQMPKRLWWRRNKVASLENLCRLPLERCTGEDCSTQMSFQEFYSLFFNYYQSFNLLAFYTLTVAQKMVYTRELIDGLAEYLCERHAMLDASARNTPILAIGSKIGKLGGLLNATKRLPVPVVSASESPNSNPYLVAIPQHLQNEFRPHPIQKLRIPQALEKYEPAIVIYTDMPTGVDETFYIRKQGSVREYVMIGVADSYLEGLGWDTWGNVGHRSEEERKSAALPPYMADGWKRLDLNHLSRWVMHRADSDLCQGLGSVTSFMRAPLFPRAQTIWRYRAMRLRPFY